MNTQLAIQETDLELVVSEKTLGSLTTNAKQIRDIVMANLPKYDISNYTDDNIEQAKKDKAALNKASKMLNAKRLEIEKEFMKPFGEFKEVVNETVQLISQCSAKIDEVVKKNELIYKGTKRKAIQDYFEANNANLVDFKKIFREEWLNKTVKDKIVFTEIDTILSRIESEIQTIQSMPEDSDVLLTYYMDTLNINSTIQYGNRLREQRERVKAAEEAKKRAEEDKRVAEQVISAKTHGIEQEAVNTPYTEPTPIRNYIPHFDGPIAEKPELLTRAFKVTATRENIISLGDFMNEKGIDFDKIDLEVELCKTDAQTIIRLLEYSADLIERCGNKPAELDKVRQLRKMSNKLQKNN